MSRVINYIASTVWAMREREFSGMLAIAARDEALIEKIFVEAKFAEVHGSLKPEAMTTKKGEPLKNTSYVELREGSVAVIDVNGRLAKRMDFFTEVCEGGTSTEKLLKDFQTALDSPNVSSIVFNIDSPGGEAFGINELAQHIFNARGKKPIKAYVSGLGCSGAYWIASACDEIITDKAAFLGSIGVVSMWLDDTEAYKKLGFDKKVVTSSNAPKKRLDLNTDEGMTEFQSELDAMENVFISSVKRNRGKKSNKDVINDFNQGGVLVGNDAVKAGMADRTGSLEQVIKELARKGKNQASYGAQNNGEKQMSLQERLKAFFASEEIKPLTEGKEFALIEANKDAPESNTSVETPALQAERQRAEKAEKELADIKAEQAKGRKVQLEKEAENFALSEIKAGRMVTAEKPKFLAAYAQAAADDEASPLAEGSRVETLKTLQSGRSTHGFFNEQLAPDSVQVLNNDGSIEMELDKSVNAQVKSYVAIVQPKAKESIN